MAQFSRDDLQRNFKYDCFEAGSAEGCLKLVYLYSKSQNLDDHVKGSKVINYCCQKLKDSTCCIELSRIYARGIVVKQNMNRAEQLLKQECDNGFPKACGSYAIHLFETDRPAMAEKIAERECNKKKSPCGFSCAILSNSFAQKNNSKLALHYGEKACNMKDQDGCMLMYSFYEKGNLVTADPEKAKEFKNKADGIRKNNKKGM